MNKKELIKHMQSGKIFTAHFLKKDKKTKQFIIPRTMNARYGVKKYSKGIGLKFNPIAKNLLSVYDLQEKKYRFVNLNTLIWVKINGKTIFTKSLS